MRIFNEELYTKRNIIKIDDSLFANYKKNLCTLTQDESSKLDEKINLNELQTQIFSTKNNKSPGPMDLQMNFLRPFGMS